MKIRGGYTPKIKGKPAHAVSDGPTPGQLCVALRRGELVYAPTVQDGDAVGLGQAIAQAEFGGGSLSLPAPAAGRVKLRTADDGSPEAIVLESVNLSLGSSVLKPMSAPSASAGDVRKALAAAGVWPLLWSSRTRGMPMLDGTEQPDRIIVNCVNAEPFVACALTVLKHEQSHILAGFDFLPRLAKDGGSVHVVLGAKPAPEELALQKTLAAKPWIRFESAPLRYPVEHPEVVTRALHKALGVQNADSVSWTLDAQALAALGACLAKGLPLCRRLVAVGGPAAKEPRHVDVRVGARVESFVGAEGDNVILRGGLMTGEPIDPKVATVGYDDTGFFVLARPGERELLSFVNPGFDRVSVMPLFASRLTGAADSHITTSLRGERRPCIACGLCESLCPVGILPQVLHRYLYRNAMDEVEAAGIHRCIRCGICAYVCPSKIELVDQFTKAQEQLIAEHAEAAGATEGPLTANVNKPNNPH